MIHTEADSGGSSSGGGSAQVSLRPRYRQLMPGEEHEGVVCSIVVRAHAIGHICASQLLSSLRVHSSYGTVCSSSFCSPLHGHTHL